MLTKIKNFFYTIISYIALVDDIDEQLSSQPMTRDQLYEKYGQLISSSAIYRANEWEKRFSDTVWMEAETIADKVIKPHHIDEAVRNIARNDDWHLEER